MNRRVNSLPGDFVNLSEEKKKHFPLVGAKQRHS